MDTVAVCISFHLSAGVSYMVYWLEEELWGLGESPFVASYENKCHNPHARNTVMRQASLSDTLFLFCQRNRMFQSNIPHILPIIINGLIRP